LKEQTPQARGQYRQRRTGLPDTRAPIQYYQRVDDNDEQNLQDSLRNGFHGWSLMADCQSVAWRRISGRPR